MVRGGRGRDPARPAGDRWWRTRLRGKHKPTFAPHIDTGDFVIVINAEKAVLTGRKEEQKIYHHHSGYPGGHQERDGGQAAASAARSSWSRRRSGACCPRVPSAAGRSRKLKVYAGGEHPHQAQQPAVARRRRGPQPLSPVTGEIALNQNQYYGTGRRKTATARVFLRPGAGERQGQRPAHRPATSRTKSSRWSSSSPCMLTETRREVRHRRHRRGRRQRGPGRRHPPRHLARPARVTTPSCATASSPPAS